jgi:hypothetical protein
MTGTIFETINFESGDRDQGSGMISADLKFLVSSWIREHTLKDSPLVVDSKTLGVAKNAVEPSLSEKAQRLMLRSRTRNPRVGACFLWNVAITKEDGRNPSDEISDILGHCYIRDLDELSYVVDQYLIGAKGLLEPVDEDFGHRRGVRITPKGWAYFDDMQRNKESQQGFIAMCFAPELNVLHDAIWSAIGQAGWSPFSLKEERKGLLLPVQEQGQGDQVRRIHGSLRSSAKVC